MTAYIMFGRLVYIPYVTTHVPGDLVVCAFIQNTVGSYMSMFVFPTQQLPKLSK
jgi:hypothetical protein